MTVDARQKSSFRRKHSLITDPGNELPAQTYSDQAQSIRRRKTYDLDCLAAKAAVSAPGTGLTTT